MVLVCLLFMAYLSVQQMFADGHTVICDSLETVDSVSITVQPPLLFADSLIQYGSLFLKTPYHYGSCGPNTFDCSGFTSYVYRHFGYELAHSSGGQCEQTTIVKRKDLCVGDLVFFESRRATGRIGHVGIVVDVDTLGDFHFLHASVQSGVVISHSSEPYYKSRYLKAGRVVAQPVNENAGHCD